MTSVAFPPDARPGRGATRRLRRVLSLDDFEAVARSFLPRPIFGYVAGGSETCATLRDNRTAFAEWAMLPTTLVDTSTRSQKRTLFGIDYSSPFGISPVGFSALSAYRGDLVLAQGARRAGIPMIMSGASLIRLEDVASAVPGVWFQAYLPGDERTILAMLDRIERAGIGTLVLTVDMPVISNRENNHRTGFSAPLNPTPRLAWDGLVRPRWTVGTFLHTIVRHGMPHFENSTVERGPAIVARNLARHMPNRDRLDWSHVDLIRKHWSGRFVIKGILTPGDATKARESGVDGVIVSNHGGRQMDCLPSPLRVLPDIVNAIGGAIPVMLDSGVRRGTDVLKALALGADFVFLGRPFIYAAAIGGEAGVAHAHRLLAEEVDRDMSLLGIISLSQLSRRHLMRIAGEAGTV
ncbi:alpha-hydroxy acid oxidase [Mesorhizobium australicum]|uniref:L-lactate dehydrogenase (Cytochrome) n=1 Tax=Mesorhizobium australicum TaxID=536018 RepID=A0A1X7MV37_9HYPH|nr:alpha-hydroxy acid oxidase [Mesorhizobium australicum]SMH28222.1 L-lactate dehydrogenase (cytochrome) [Mesorhizobium australicum]